MDVQYPGAIISIAAFCLLAISIDLPLLVPEFRTI
jgi:hypothetical protein